MILTIVFWWGLRSPKITPAKEKEKKIERVKRRTGGEEKSTGGTQFLYWLLWTLKIAFERQTLVEKAELKRSNIFKTSSKTCITRFTSFQWFQIKARTPPFLLENYMVKKRRSKAKYSYFIVHFDPLAANTCTASKSEATRTCQGVLLAFIPCSPVVNRSLLFKSKFCVGFPCLLVIPLFGFFFSGYSLVLIDKRVKWTSENVKGNIVD